MRTVRNGTLRVRELQAHDLDGLADLVPDAWMPGRVQEVEEPVPATDGWSWGGSSRIADLQCEVADDAC